MCPAISRRSFVRTTAGGLLSAGAWLTLAERLAAADLGAELGHKTKVRIGKVYVGHERPGWPLARVDLAAEMRQYEEALARLAGALGDVEFLEGGLVGSAEQLAQAREKLKGASGILVIHLTLGTGPQIAGLMELGLPVMIFTTPYSGHEWHIVASWQREGKRVDVHPSSRYEDIPVALRPFRAIQRLRETRVLHISQNDADPKYVAALKDKFGTEVLSLHLDDLQQAFAAANRDEVEADAERWLRQARQVVEPSRGDVRQGAQMYVAMKDLLLRHRAQAVTMNCLGMGLMDRGMGYPCLGFVRLNNALLAGVCEADLKSTLTQLIFTYLVGRTGFVTDPMFDLSNSTIIHAHCVAATQMEGPASPAAPYSIRTHLEDGRGASLQVQLPVGGQVSMARLIGTDLMLFSTGEAVDSPLVERGCRSKLTVRVEQIDRFLSDWSCGLHRVIFYGDHTRDLARFCRYMKIRLLREGTDDLQNVPGLEWEPHVHA